MVLLELDGLVVDCCDVSLLEEPLMPLEEPLVEGEALPPIEEDDDGEAELLLEGEEPIEEDDEGDVELVPLLLGEVLEPPIDEPDMPLCDEVEPVPPLELEAPPSTPSAASVCWSMSPEPLRLLCCWNLLSAALVFGPICPSTGPGSKPLSFRACWTWLTSEPPDIEDCPMPPDLLEAAPRDAWTSLSLSGSFADEAPIPPDALEALPEVDLSLDDCCDDDGDEAPDMLDFSLSFAETAAAVDRAKAAMTNDASFMCIPFLTRGYRAANK